MLVAGIVASPVSAQVVEWNNLTGNPDPWFDSAGNWLGGVAPIATDAAQFNQAGTYQVWWNANTVASTPTIQVLDINAGDVTLLQNDLANPATKHQLTITGVGTYSDFSVSGVGTTLTLSGLNLNDLGGLEVLVGATLTLDGSHAAGTQLSVGTDMEIKDTLNVQAGALLNNAAGSYVGRPITTNAVATVTGAGSQWNTTGTLNIAQLGHGTLNVEDGGVISSGTGWLGGSPSGVGVANVTGTGSQWNNTGELRIGNSGSGTLNILNGGVVANTAGYIGFNSASTSVATVNGAGSHWNNASDLTIGNDGNGMLNIQAGGVVTNAAGYIGFNSLSTSVATVNGAGSQWNNSGDLTIGNDGNGTLNIQAGGVTTNQFGYIGRNAGSTSIATVTGTGSQWNNTGELSVGYAGQGTLHVEDGAVLDSQLGYIANLANSTGSVTVTGSGSRWNLNSTDSQWNFTNDLYAGRFGAGDLSIEAGGVVSSRDGFVGKELGSVGTVTVSGVGSKWEGRRNLYVGSDGDGTLNILDGGEVTTRFGYVNTTNTSGAANVTVSGAGSKYNSLSTTYVGTRGEATLNILDGGQFISGGEGLFVGNGEYQINSGHGVVNVDGAGSSLLSMKDLTLGEYGSGEMHIGNGATVTNRDGRIARYFTSISQVTVSGVGSQWINREMYVGQGGKGTLLVEAGGLVTTSTIAHVGQASDSPSLATVTGSGSQWNNAGYLVVGMFGNGTLNIEDGGLVTSNIGFIGSDASGTGLTTVTGSGSQWSVVNQMGVGFFGNGTLNIEAGGFVNSGKGFIGESAGAIGVANVTGAASQWNVANDLNVGGNDNSEGGNGTLNILNNGVVTVGGTTRIWGTGAVNLNGGSFNFGLTTLPEYVSINAVSGTLIGAVLHDGYSNITALAAYETAQSDPNVDITGVTVANTGVIYGNGTLQLGLVNKAGGEVETIAGERMRFTASNNSNDGEINNFGGQIRFEQGILNEPDGLIGGRGQFIATGGWTNSGVMAFSGGLSDIHGDLANTATGSIHVAGGATATFYDDVTMDPANMNIEVASNSFAVFFGSYNGGSTGTGTVHALGDLRPGHSPAAVNFGGDLTLGSATETFVELGGTLAGSYDALSVDGNLLLDGNLFVSLIDDFTPSMYDEFLIADVAGSLSGEFAGLPQGALVGNFDSTNLFINYAAGDGNDIALVAALPGEFDFDFDVDGVDFLNWQRGASPNPLSVSDLTAWQANYGSSLPVTSEIIAIPEPKGIMLALIGLVLSTQRRRSQDLAVT